MKKIKNYIFLICALFMFPIILTGCNETTFDSVPWNSSEMLPEEVVELANESKQYMIEDIGLPVIYETTTTYTFSKRLDGNFENRIIRDEQTISLSNSNQPNAVAKIVFSRYVDDNLISSRTETYVQDEAKVYISQTQYLETESAESTSLLRQSYSTVDSSFSNLLSEVVYNVNANETNVVNQKTFENVEYYKLTSQAVSSTSGLDLLNRDFVENEDIFNNPGLFEIYDKSLDYVISFNCQYGINPSNYLTYFAMNYEIQNGSDSFQGDRAVYLRVSSVTNLVSFGASMELPTVPENKDLYTVSTFMDIAGQDDSYVIYQDSSESRNNRVTVYKDGQDYCFKYEENNAGTFLSTKYYFARFIDSRYIVYELNINAGTYKDVSNTFNPLFLEFDYSQDLLYEDNDNGIYQFGSSESYIEIGMQGGEIYSVKTQNSQPWYVLEYGFGRPNDIYDLTGLIEEVVSE